MTAELVGKLRRLSLDVDRADPLEIRSTDRRKPLVLLGLLLGAPALFAGGYYAASGSGAGRSAAAAAAAPAAQALAPPRAALSASGYVVARRRATIAAQVTGQIRSIFVQQGQRVERGQLLARLDGDTAAASVATADASTAAARGGVFRLEAEHEAARENAERISVLYERGFATKRDFSAARAAESSLRAQVSQARASHAGALAAGSGARVSLNRFEIRAPFSGVVVDINAQPGEVISPVSAGGFTRTGICTIVDMDSLELEVDVAEAYISRVRPGQKVTAALDAYPDEELRGSVIAVVPIADRSRASFRVRIRLDDTGPRILPEMAVKVQFAGAEFRNAGSKQG
jgi:RND family efflux transporter MFP subunit